MPERLLICTDLDRTLIPNGTQPESNAARKHFALLVDRPEVTLAYVSGRHRALVEAAIDRYRLPPPDFVLGDVGTSIYELGRRQDWQRWPEWEAEIAADWNGLSHAELKRALGHLSALKLQEEVKQNTYKLSYYVPMQSDRAALSEQIEQCIDATGARLRLVWSVDEMAGVALLDVLPASASKFHAIETLMQKRGFTQTNTVFCGDSGNDIEVLASPIPAVLVANAQPDVQALARRLSSEAGFAERLYLAQGNFMGLNGNYSAGILEGIAHYHPDTVAWMGFVTEEAEA
jgi:sucrose-6F-phosphate phosphohydrolase